METTSSVRDNLTNLYNIRHFLQTSAGKMMLRSIEAEQGFYKAKIESLITRSNTRGEFDTNKDTIMDCKAMIKANQRILALLSQENLELQEQTLTEEVRLHNKQKDLDE